MPHLGMWRKGVKIGRYFELSFGAAICVTSQRHFCRLALLVAGEEGGGIPSLAKAIISEVLGEMVAPGITDWPLHS